MTPQILIICGPTGSGKSGLALKLAKILDTEIISADSLAIYKNLDIGTAKPTKEELNQVTHQLIDVVSPFDSFSVSDYEELALPHINRLISNGKIPIICGGTGFYINSVLYKMSYGNTTENIEIREKFFELSKTKGVDYVWEELNKVDPETANKLHKNDLVRVIRALEIFYATGKKKSDQNDKEIPRYSYLAVMIDMDREVLYDRINRRVDLMVEQGVVEETQNLLKKHGRIKNFICTKTLKF